MSYRYNLIKTQLEGGVLTATINNPPINLMTLELFAELGALSTEVEQDEAVKVLVMKSANPDFFIAHFDVEAILGFPTDEPARRSDTLNDYHAMCERFRTMPKATIAQIEGRVGGGGSELVSSMDMRFGVLGKTKINQMEVAAGILPGGSGTQRLPRLVGRGRALEIILGSDDLDAETAEKWGYLNRAFAADDIGPFVDGLAKRIASFPAEAIALAKDAVDSAEKDIEEGLKDEAYNFQRTLRTDGAQTNMRKFLELGGQTPEGEMRMSDLAKEVGEATKV